MNPQTTIQQLGGNRIFAMAFTPKGSHHTEHALTLKVAPTLVKGTKGTKGKATHLRITLTPADTYTVEALRVGRTDALGKVVGASSDVYADSLASTVESLLGLRLSL